MSRLGDDFGGQVKQRSGWLIPLAVLVVIAALSALVLAYYFAPTPPELVNEQSSPTDDTHRVALDVGSMSFRIPSNYLLFASGRKGGPRQSVELIAFLPDLRGYSSSESQALASNTSDSEAIHFKMAEDENNLSEKDRLQRVYLAQVVAPAGAPGPFGLRQYAFRPETGYRDDDLFVGQTDVGPMALRCTRASEIAPSPNCLREMLLGPGVSLSYRFKRAHLEHWHDIDASVRQIFFSFIRKSQRAR
jgi:hypothetical protein